MLRTVWKSGLLFLSRNALEWLFKILQGLQGKPTTYRLTWHSRTGNWFHYVKKKNSCSAWSCISLPVPATKPLAWSRCHFQTLGDSKGINVVLSLNEVVCCFSRYTFLLYAQKLFTFWKITSKKITADRVALRTCPQLISRNGRGQVTWKLGVCP